VKLFPVTESNCYFLYNASDKREKMMSLKYSAIIIPLLLAACAHAPQQAVKLSPQLLATQQKLNLPKIALSKGMLYEFLLGDIARQRGNPELAAKLYLDLAKQTQDPRVARHAAQLAFVTHDTDQSFSALRLWMKLEPTSRQAKLLLTRVLVSAGKLAEAKPYLAEMLAEFPTQAGHTFTQIYALLLRHQDKSFVLKLLHELAQPYPRVAEGYLVQAQAATTAGLSKRALAEVRKARDLRPELETAVLLESQLLQHDSPQQSLQVLKSFLASYPDANQAHLLYARMLLKQKNYAEARAEFQKLLDEHPGSADMAFAVAMLSMQMGELDRAESELRLALVKGKKDESTVFYYLGQLNEAQKHNDEAMKYYRQVVSGDNLFAARLRVAYLLYKADKLNDALAYLQQSKPLNNQQRVQLLSIEAQMLRDSKQIESAYQVLKQGLKKLPNHPDLLYEAGMLAEQLGKYKAFEKMMRQVIDRRPDYAQAYNALGYSLLDRNERMTEAMLLVEKASQLAPGDAGIIDSLGWGYYRLGELQKSLKYLRRAYSTNPDPEIAAHLGEVLWMQGMKSEAKDVWSGALKLHPDHPVLQSILKKFSP